MYIRGEVASFLLVTRDEKILVNLEEQFVFQSGDSLLVMRPGRDSVEKFREVLASMGAA